MPSIFVDVNPTIIDWVSQYASNATNSGVLDDLAKWKNGEKRPTFKQVETVSKAIHIPFGYFFLQSPPVETFPVLQYRTIDGLNEGNPSRDLIDTINDMESVQEWMHDYMIASGYDRLQFVASCHNENDKQAIAKRFREILGIAPDWYKQTNAKTEAFKFFRSKFEDIGIIVMMSGIVGNNTHRSLHIEEFRAFALIDDYAPLIFINFNDSQGAKLFSLIHEAVHILLGTSNFYNDRYGIADNVSVFETLCNAVAAEILVPSDYFEKEWSALATRKLEIKIQQLAETFNCGMVVIARKALDNHYISRNQYRRIVDDAMEKFRDSQKKGTGGNYYSTMATRIDARFIIALDNSVKEGKTLFTDAYRLTNTTRKTFSNLTEGVRGIS